MLFYVRYRVLAVVLYCISQEVGLDVFCVREVEAAFCRISFVEACVVLLPLVVVVDEWEVKTLVL
jgi:hypothetical protein